MTDDEVLGLSTHSREHLFDEHLRLHLADMRANGSLELIKTSLEDIRDYRVLIIGDAIIDEYQFVVPSGKSVKEHMIAALFQGQEVYAGGVFAAANHVASFCAQVDVITSLGDQDSFGDLIESTMRPNITLRSFMRAGTPTTRKCRFIDQGYMRKLFEVYFMDDTPLPAAIQVELNDLLRHSIADYDVVIVTDFGHGLIHGSTVDLLAAEARFLAVNTQANSANFGFNTITKFPRADYVCIDGPEARLATKDKFTDIDEIAGTVLPKAIDCSKIIVTKGPHGCVTWDRSNGLHNVPVLTGTIVDTVGAGDAFFSITAPLVAAGLDMPRVGFVGNAAGALKVGIVGHRSSVDKAALVAFATELLE
jgi:sugar/nucleoside kinase (ribokinase family)